jgi:hypothetical protein
MYLCFEYVPIHPDMLACHAGPAITFPYERLTGAAHTLGQFRLVQYPQDSFCNIRRRAGYDKSSPGRFQWGESH